MTRDAPPRQVHHELPVHQLVLLLETEPERGLSVEEAARRLADVGPNVLPGSPAEGRSYGFCCSFTTP